MQDRIVWLLAAVSVAALLAVAAWRHADDSSAQSPSGTSQHPPLVLSTDLSDRIRIEVLNGCGTPQVAARMTRRARSRGVDVIDEGNADSFGYLESIVIDRAGDMARARQVAAALGIPNIIQQISRDPARLAEITVIIGRDHEQLGLLTP